MRAAAITPSSSPVTPAQAGISGGKRTPSAQEMPPSASMTDKRRASGPHMNRPTTPCGNVRKFPVENSRKDLALSRAWRRMRVCFGARGNGVSRRVEPGRGIPGLDGVEQAMSGAPGAISRRMEISAGSEIAMGKKLRAVDRSGVAQG